MSETELMPDQEEISPDVAFIDTEYTVNGAGQYMYRHVIVTEWEFVEED